MKLHDELELDRIPKGPSIGPLWKPSQTQIFWKPQHKKTAAGDATVTALSISSVPVFARAPARGSLQGLQQQLEAQRSPHQVPETCQFSPPTHLFSTSNNLWSLQALSPHIFSSARTSQETAGVVQLLACGLPGLLIAQLCILALRTC
jgi:hypothetical protein